MSDEIDDELDESLVELIRNGGLQLFSQGVQSEVEGLLAAWSDFGASG